MSACLALVEVLRGDDDDRLAVLLDDSLRAFGAHKAKKLAEPGLCLVKLPGMLRHG